MRHDFTSTLDAVLGEHFGDNAPQIFKNSELIQYLNIKTVSANRGSKSRGSFGNIYAIYVLVEDYVKSGFTEEGDYSKYDGAIFSDLFRRQRELPFGAKLQNHALNHRMNQEFRKNFPNCEYVPIIRVVETRRYWINENLILVRANNELFNIAPAIIDIIDAYVDAKQGAFQKFIETSEKLKTIGKENQDEVKNFILSLLEPNIDARIFEIASYAILKYDYFEQSVYLGWTPENVTEESLMLYKTGRTNANDGGIDFVMKPLGRFFQVTETTDVKKYFLDIDKLEKFPITFVVKLNDSVEDLRKRIHDGAVEQFKVDQVVNKYTNCIEEIINIPKLKKSLEQVMKNGDLANILDEIIKQSKVEFNYEDSDDEEE